MTNENRIITGVAIKQGDMIHSLPKPKRHSDVIIKMIMSGNYRMVEEQQGFVCNDGSFLNRTDARTLAVENGQIRKSDASKTSLQSNDLW